MRYQGWLQVAVGVNKDWSYRIEEQMRTKGVNYFRGSVAKGWSSQMNVSSVSKTDALPGINLVTAALRRFDSYLYSPCA